MSQDHSVSRRASLKTLGAAGAALVLVGPSAAPRAEATAACDTQARPSAGSVDVAIERFAKGHS